jgi:hypothetical protein
VIFHSAFILTCQEAPNILAQDTKLRGKIMPILKASDYEGS